MTATATPPAARRSPARTPDGPPPDPAATGRRRPLLRVPAEASLWVLTASVAYGFGRLFVDRSFLPPVLLAAGISHAVALLLRRLRVPVGVALPLSLLAMAVVLSWMFYPATTRFGLPSGLTWDAFTGDLADAAERFRRDQAPVEAIRGFVAGSAVGFWLVAFLGDWSAFRLWAAVEAIIPAGSLFVFAALLGADQGRLAATALFFVAALGFLLLQRAARLETSPAWIGGHARRGVAAQLRAGAASIVGAVVLVALVGPLLPGAGAKGLLDIRRLGGDNDSRVALSPLVDIRQRLVDQREAVAFTVTSPQHSYWRLTALDQFDGRTWRSSKRFERVAGQLSHDETRPGTFRSIDQQFEVVGLSQIWLPAAFEPQFVTAVDRDVRWDPSTSTLIVDRETSNGWSYGVSSAVATFDAETLRAGTGGVPPRVQEQYLTLPRSFPAEVEQLAETITAGAPTAYDAAMALQQYFRTNFTYSTDVPGGQDINAIEDFLFSPARAGYCEQFAGTYAAMARSIGLPARVAVGFTLGDPVRGRPDTYVVKGRHAHAWPEVYLAGAGWVLFEPTPGRGAPNAPYTGTEEQQDSSIAPDGTTTSTAPLPPGDPAAAATPDAPAPADTATGVEQDPTAGPAAPDGSGGPSPAVVLGTVVLGLLVAYLVGVPAARRWRRARRRRTVTDPAARVELAWREATGALRLVGVQAQAGETPTELAARAATAGGDGGELAELAELTTAVRYGVDGADAVAAARATALAAAVTAAVRERTGAISRYVAELDPRRRRPGGG